MSEKSFLSGINVNALEIPTTLKSSQDMKIIETIYGGAF